MFRIVETFNNAVVAASAVQYHAGSEILHALMVAAVDANLLTAHDVGGECARGPNPPNVSWTA